MEKQMELCNCTDCTKARAIVAEALASDETGDTAIVGITLKQIDELEREGWEDISSEQVREYIYPDGSSEVIYNPLVLHISESGGNRIVDQAGVSHYIKAGWNHLAFRVHPGFSFFSL